MSRAQLQQDITNALALAGQDWVQGSAALNAAFANMLTTWAIKSSQCKHKPPLLPPLWPRWPKSRNYSQTPGPFDGSMSKFEEWWAKVKAWQPENHLAVMRSVEQASVHSK